MSKYAVNRHEKDLAIHEIIVRGSYNIAESQPGFASMTKKERGIAASSLIAMAATAGSQPTSETIKIHNTVFILIHDKENMSAYVTARNADTPRNFVSNVIELCQKARKADVGWLVFVGDKSMHGVVNQVAKSPAAAEWGARIQQAKGNPNFFRFIISLGVQRV